MKKLFYVCIAALMAAGITSCSDDDEPVVKNPDMPTVSRGAYVLTQGNWTTKVEGSLNVLDYATGVYSRNVFQSVNKRSLGATPQCGVVYGSKIYIGMLESKTIEIIDRTTFKSIKQIKLQNPDQGTQPNSMATKDGKVYISMFDGYLARLDTLSQTIDASVKVGNNPDEIAIFRDRIYVPNSDGMNFPDYGKTASVVTINPFKVEATIDVPLNPGKFMTDGSTLFLYARGNYDGIPGAVYKFDSNYRYEKLFEATMAGIYGEYICYINKPFGVEAKSGKYNITSGKITDIQLDELIDPTNMGVDPKTGNIIVSSNADLEWDNYTRPGYLYEYDPDGKLIKRYDSGTGPACIFFNLE